MHPVANECLVSLGFDFAELTIEQRQARLPGLESDYGYAEAFYLLSRMVDGLYAALLAEYPNFEDAQGNRFWDVYHSRAFTPGGCFSYDVPAAILEQLLITPLDDYNDETAHLVGERAFQLLKTPPATPSLADNLQAILTAS